jgi:hypothetical protein
MGVYMMEISALIRHGQPAPVMPRHSGTRFPQLEFQGP